MKRLSCIILLVTLMTLTYVSEAHGDSLPESAYISGFVGHPQSYAISCESRSAADWAGFWGVSIGETEFLDALPRADNPDEGFVGDPNDAWGNIPPHGYGVHAGPVAETLREFGLKAEERHDVSWDDLRQEIAAKRPVIVWIIGQMWEGTPLKYKAHDGSTARVAVFEHTMTLVGYSPDSVQVVDASSGQYETYALDDFLNSWSVLGDMAVFGLYEPPSAADSDKNTSPNTYGESYTVQAGDHVMALARRFGVPWLELAQLNSLVYPFIIYPGQVLQLPKSEQPEAKQPDLSLPMKDFNYQVDLPMVQLNRIAQIIPYSVVNPTRKTATEFVIFLP